MIPLFSQKTYKGSLLRYASFFPAGKSNEIMLLLMKEKEEE